MAAASTCGWFRWAILCHNAERGQVQNGVYRVGPLTLELRCRLTGNIGEAEGFPKRRAAAVGRPPLFRADL
jgi:hypothetical protein